MMQAATQLRIDLGLATGRPLRTLSAACGDLDRDAVDVRALWESGRLEFCFNIARRDSQHMEPRLAVASIRAYLGGDFSHLKPEERARDGQRLDAYLKALLKPVSRLHVYTGARVIRGVDLRRLLNCSHQHLAGLIQDHNLVEVPNVQRAAKESRLVSAASVAEFLKARRLP